jgi:hypothetical protein
MAHPPGRRLADADRFGEAHRGHALVGLHNVPKPGQPDAERKLCRVKGRPRCGGEP